MPNPPKKKEKPLTIRLDGAHRQRVRAIMERLGIENPQDAVRTALKFYADFHEPPPLAASTIVMIDERIRLAIARGRWKRS